MPNHPPESYPRKPYLSSFGRNRKRQMGQVRGALYQEGLGKWGISLPQDGEATHPAVWFGAPKARYVLELGIGTGDYLLACAARDAGAGFIGCEPYELGIATAIKHAVERGLDNIRFYQGDGRDLLCHLPDGCLGGANVLFPDPWPKARHHKRRLVNDYLIQELARLIEPGGTLFLATDHPDYATWMLEVMQRQTAFDWQTTAPNALYSEPEGWVPTRYYQKALREGRKPLFLHYRRKTG